MKNISTKIVISLLLVVTVGFFILCSCNNNANNRNSDDSQSIVSETASNETNSPSNEESLFFEADFNTDSEMQMIFYELIKDNPIDSDYNSEACDSTTLALRNHQKKYIDIWLDELAFSCESFSKLLNEEDRDVFLKHEQNWENSLNEEFNLLSSIFSDPEYNLHLGSNFPLENDIEYLQRIRERTLYIKYLQYVFESSDYNDSNANVVFQYTSAKNTNVTLVEGYTYNELK